MTGCPFRSHQAPSPLGHATLTAIVIAIPKEPLRRTTPGTGAGPGPKSELAPLVQVRRKEERKEMKRLLLLLLIGVIEMGGCYVGGRGCGCRPFGGPGEHHEHHEYR